MKRPWFELVVIAILAPTLAMAQQPDGAPSGALKFEDGKIANGVYSNECLGFSLQIPAGWDLNVPFGDADGKARHLPGGLLLLLLHQQKEKPPGNTITLLARDATGRTVATRDFVSNVAHRFVNAYPEGRELIRDAFAIEYGGRPFYRADTKQSFPDGMTVHAADVFTKFRGYLIGAALEAVSSEELEDAANSLRGVSFAEDQPNPKCVMGGEDPASKGVVGVIGGVIGPAPSARQSDSALPQRVRVSEAVMQSLLIKKVEPETPGDFHIQGTTTVVLKAVVSRAGEVTQLMLVSGHPMLVQAAIEAARQWKYKPYLLNGQPVEVETQITVAFQLSAK